MVVARDDGRREMLDMTHLADRHVRHGWVRTIHSAQGATSDRVLAHVESYRANIVDACAVYVAISRARKLATLYTDSRADLPTLGRFMQTDPIGYGDGLNMYNYVGSDPVNRSDPSGLKQCFKGMHWVSGPQYPNNDKGACVSDSEDIVVQGRRDLQPVFDDLAFRAGFQKTGAPQTLQRNGHKPPSHDEGDPDYNRDLNKCRALADVGNRAAASRCYSSAEKRKGLRDGGAPESQLLPLITRKNAAGVAGGVAVGTILYWVISEGSRILFPPRNLVPVP